MSFRCGVTASAAVIAAGLTLALAPTGADARNDHGRLAAGLGGAIIGGAVVSAMSPTKTVTERVYVPAAAPPPPAAAPPDGFSPGPGIVCYASQRACYTMGGGYNPQWTWQVYAR